METRVGVRPGVSRASAAQDCEAHLLGGGASGPRPRARDLETERLCIWLILSISLDAIPRAFTAESAIGLLIVARMHWPAMCRRFRV